VKPRLLLVDDEPNVLSSLRRQLTGEAYDVLTATGGAEALALLEKEEVSLILSDMRMPGMDGIAFLRQAALLRPHAVRMVLSGYAEASLILAAVNQGHVWRYITKPWKEEELRLALHNALDFYESEAARRQLVHDLEARTMVLDEANIHLRVLATTDGLTGLCNRRAFDQALDLEWRRAIRLDTSLSLVMIDIDHFKSFNDTYGHQAGDDCLRKISIALQRCARRSGDTVARYGGEEFAILLPYADVRAAREVAEFCRERVRELGITHDGSLTSRVVTLSAGVSCLHPQQGADSGILVQAADRALYCAKSAGRDHVVVECVSAHRPQTGEGVASNEREREKTGSGMGAPMDDRER